MRRRRISSTSRNPSVVISATRAPFPSRMALVATVVPCMSWPMLSAATPWSEKAADRPLTMPTL